MVCTRCEGCGFLNLHQIDDELIANGNTEGITMWIKVHSDHDVTICDCCGDGESWYGEAGEHHYDGAKWDTPDIPDCI